MKKTMFRGLTLLVFAAMLIALASCNGEKSGGGGKGSGADKEADREIADNGGNAPVPGGGGEPIVGDNWRTWRGYSSDYDLDDRLTVTFSGEIKDGDGDFFYGVYNAANGGWLGDLVFEEKVTYEDTIGDEFLIEDVTGDGTNDIGVRLKNGAIVWFSYDPEKLPAEGMFTYYETDESNASWDIAREPAIDSDELPDGVTYSEDYVLQGDPGEGISASDAAKEVFAKARHSFGYQSGGKMAIILTELDIVEDTECYIFTVIAADDGQYKFAVNPWTKDVYAMFEENSVWERLE